MAQGTRKRRKDADLIQGLTPWLGVGIKKGEVSRLSARSARHKRFQAGAGKHWLFLCDFRNFSEKRVKNFFQIFALNSYPKNMNKAIELFRFI